MNNYLSFFVPHPQPGIKIPLLSEFIHTVIIIFTFSVVKRFELWYHDNMKKLFFLFIFVFLGACSATNPLENFRFQTVVAPPYVNASWWRIQEPGQPLKIYIEGDGSAFDDEGVPTDNPTPKSLFLRTIAAKDPSPNVAYLGRPCQYMKTTACTQTDWTTGRFSEKIISSMERSILELMRRAKTQQVILIGYSGGAQIAGLVAVRNPDHVIKVITIAGVLDHEAWSSYHQDPPLDQSLNLWDFRDQFLKIDQIHFAGEKDVVVPPALIEAFVEASHPVIIVPKATHNTGYQSVYNKIYEIR